jgi:lipopolysaccharide transport system ATP-binding protein
MSDAAVRIHGLGKRYALGARRERYHTARDAIARAGAALLRRGRPSYSTREWLWAVRDVSFDVARGDVVGVVGRNGAGKSTLLKLLARITTPTVGSAEIRGRVGSLLEVGTGFHLELTGRENVYLNGAILGMRRREIAAKFDEIVAFAEVGRFIDTPVKHYSSGMQMRLAFSVAAHLETEVLLVDEILAVGDLAFQRKCLGKMDAVASSGRTVLFVSHQLGAVRELCRRVVLIEAGRVAFDGGVAEGLARYVRLVSDDPAHAAGGGTVLYVARINGRTPAEATIRSSERLIAEAGLTIPEALIRAVLFCILHDAQGSTVVHDRVDLRDLSRSRLDSGSYRVRVEFPAMWLAPGAYTLYFKLLSTAADRGADERHLSERVALDVTGTVANHAESRLVPETRWSVWEDARDASLAMSEPAGTGAGR